MIHLLDWYQLCYSSKWVDSSRKTMSAITPLCCHLLYRLKPSFRPCLNPLTPSTLRSLGIDCGLIMASLLPEKAWYTLQLLNRRINKNPIWFSNSAGISKYFIVSETLCFRGLSCVIPIKPLGTKRGNFMALWQPAVNVLLPHLRSVTALDLGPPLPTAYYFVLPEGQLAVSAASNSLVFAKLSQWNEPVRKKMITLI